MPPTFTDTQETLLKKVYYVGNHTFGRDGLHCYMKKVKTYSQTPSVRQINNWLKRQRLSQLYTNTKNATTVLVLFLNQKNLGTGFFLTA